MVGRDRPCPCGSGNPFGKCHGDLELVAAGEELNNVLRDAPLHIVETQTEDGRTYKVVGPNPVIVQSEAERVAKWLRKK